MPPNLRAAFVQACHEINRRSKNTDSNARPRGRPRLFDCTSFFCDNLFGASRLKHDAEQQMPFNAPPCQAHLLSQPVLSAISFFLRRVERRKKTTKMNKEQPLVGKYHRFCVRNHRTQYQGDAVYDGVIPDFAAFNKGKQIHNVDHPADQTQRMHSWRLQTTLRKSACLHATEQTHNRHI